MTAQSYANHVHRPTLTAVGGFFLVVALAAFTMRWMNVGGRASFAVGLLALSAAVLTLLLISRAYTTKLQDRIIRLEMRVRGARLLTAGTAAAARAAVDQAGGGAAVCVGRGIARTARAGGAGEARASRYQARHHRVVAGSRPNVVGTQQSRNRGTLPRRPHGPASSVRTSRVLLRGQREQRIWQILQRTLQGGEGDDRAPLRVQSPRLSLTGLVSRIAAIVRYSGHRPIWQQCARPAVLGPERPVSGCGRPGSPGARPGTRARTASRHGRRSLPPAAAHGLRPGRGQ